MIIAFTLLSDYDFVSITYEYSRTVWLKGKTKHRFLLRDLVSTWFVVMSVFLHFKYKPLTYFISKGSDCNASVL